jgi:ParB family chromosome partitioning protein
MASKSRLGKGLGALFPALPGEESVEHASSEQPAMDLVVESITKSAATKVANTKTADTESVTTKTADKSDAKQASAKKSTKTAKTSDITEHGGIAKKSTARRASMPAIDVMAHPSDLFFGSQDTQDTGPAKLGKVEKPVQQHHDNDKADVSRETSKESVEELKPVEGGYLAELSLSDIGPNAHQPRTIFDEDELNELSASITEVGVLQPIVVRRRPDDQIAAAKAARNNEQSETNPFAGHLDSPYELIMGERRWRASQVAGLATIPAIVKTTTDDDMLRDALLENLHRVALNPLEEAAAYQQMIEEFGLTQVQLSKSVSKSRPQIANTLRLLNLPATVQKKVAAGVLSSGHARALLGLSDIEEMDKLASRIIAEGLSVRSTEEIVAMKIASGEQPKKPKTSKTNPWVGSPVQQSLENHFDTKVSIKGSAKHGRIEIVFSSPEDMDRILQLLVPQQPSSEAHWV